MWAKQEEGEITLTDAISSYILGGMCISLQILEATCAPNNYVPLNCKRKHNHVGSDELKNISKVTSKTRVQEKG